MFDSLSLLPPDPILGLMAKFRADPRPDKIDLGVGVYRDDAGNTPVLACVKEAEQRILQSEDSKAYVGPAGNLHFNRLIAELALGSDHPALTNQRLAVLQTPGGCGALRVAAEVILRANKSSCVWVSDPTWANHVPLLGNSGISLKHYPYYDYTGRQIKFAEMCEQLRRIPKGDYVLLHACCHNPCGADLSQEQWREVAEIARTTGFIPFVDMAYQGFGAGLDDDAYGLRLLAELLPEMVFTISCSKNFGLYRERVGAVCVVTPHEETANCVSTHLANIVRGIYSMPPSHGATIVEQILADEELRVSWQFDLNTMRQRILAMRSQLVDEMWKRGIEKRFDFITGENGMFSFLGLSPEQVNTLAVEHAVYMVDSSRINVAGLNKRNLNYFCDSLAAVISVNRP